MLLVLVLAAAPSPQLSWSVTSSRGGATIAQTASADDACLVRCSVAGKELWTKPHCLGWVNDFIFVSEDCATALVLFEYPLRLRPIGATPIAVSLAGGTVRNFRLEEVMSADSTRGEGKRVRWLEGVAGEPGVKPHVNAKGNGIEFSTLDGVSHSVRFTSPDDLAPVRAPPPKEAMYQFVDEQGSTQFVMGLSQVPKRFQKSATRVESEIGTVEAVKTPPRPAAISYPEVPSSGTVQLMPVKKSPPPAADPNGCQIFGLPGPACAAVQNQQRGNMRPLEVRLPPAPPPQPPPSPYR